VVTLAPLSARSCRCDAADLDELQAERLDLGEHTIQRGLVGQHADQHRVVTARPGLQIGERGAYRLAQAAADTYLKLRRLSVAVRTGHVRSPGEGLRLPAGAAGMVGLMMPLLVLAVAASLPPSGMSGNHPIRVGAATTRATAGTRDPDPAKR